MEPNPHITIHAELNARAKGVVIAAGWAVVLLGLVVIVGWYTHSAGIVQIHSDLFPMPYNTALGFLLSGLSILGLTWNRTYLPTLTASLVGTIAFLSISDFLTGGDFGIDQLLFEHPFKVKSFPPGRMSLMTALTFLLTSAAILIIIYSKSQSVSARLVIILGVIIGLTGFGILIVYMVGNDTQFLWKDNTNFAVYTATGFLMVGVGIGQFAWNLQGGKKVLTLKGIVIPLGLGIAIFFLTIWAWWGVETLDRNRVKGIIQELCLIIGVHVNDGLQMRLQALTRMAVRWETQGGSLEDEWKVDAQKYLDHFEDLQSLNWIDPSNQRRWVVTADNDPTVSISENTDLNRQRLFEKTIEQQKPQISPLVELKKGSKGFLLSVPLMKAGKSDGLLYGAFDLNPFLLHQSIIRHLENNYAIQLFQDQKMAYQHYKGNKPLEESWSNKELIRILTKSWTVVLIPNQQELTTLRSSIPQYVVIFGTSLAFLLIFTLVLAQSIRENSGEIKMVNMGLKSKNLENFVIQKSLNQLNLYHQQILSSVGKGIYGLNLEGKVIFINQFGAKLLGYETQELMGVCMHEKIHHTTPDGLIYPEKECPIYSTITDSSTHHSVNDVFWKKDGTSFFVQFDSTPMFNLVGHIVGTVVAFSDITLRKRAENEMRESETRYRALSNRLMEVQETERRHLALELHDELGGKLTALKLTIQKAQKLSSSKDQAEILTSGLDSIVNVFQQIRQISLELRPSMLDDLGLISALRWLTGRSAELGGLHVSFLEKEMSECIPKDVELTCYRVAQEALTNVLRHSNAKKVTVEIQGTDQGVLLVVADNGVGFDREKLQVKNILTKGAGLLGMEARVTAVGGKSFIHSVPDKGTEVCVEIPLSPGVPKQQRDKNKEEE